MNLRDLDTEGMLAVTYALLDEDGELRPILEGNSLLAEACDVLVQAHERLLPSQQRSGSNEIIIRKLTAEMTRLDHKHDRMSKGCNHALEGAIALAEDEQEEEEYRDLMAKVFPNGRSISQRSYRVQAGTAKRVRRALNDADRALLRSITIGGSTLLDYVEEWLETAILIVDKESKRARLERTESDDGISASEVRDARIAWIRAVHFLVNAIEFADIEESQRSDLLAYIEDADEKARRARRRAAANAEDGTDLAPDTDEQPSVVDEEPATEEAQEDADLTEPAE